MPTHDHHSYSDLSQGKIERINFRIKANFNDHTLYVEANYQLENPVSGSFFLDAAAIDLAQASSDDQPLKWEFDKTDEILGERLHLKGLEDVSSFTLVFTTSPEARALQWLPSAQTAGGEHPFLYSQCQAIHARSLFPCQDTPSVRFTFFIEVEVPKQLTAVVAAEQVEIRERGESRIFCYEMPQAIPSYLFALGVGNLEFQEIGPRTGIYAEPPLLESAAWEFAENELKIEEAEKLLGPYLWGRYDLLILPPSFPYGGMENPRLTFLTPTAILGTRGQTYLITHELAHAWTGNLVTNATWEDFWLNEGWTTYAEARITEVLEGESVCNLMDVYSEKYLYQDMEIVGMDSNLTCLKTSAIGTDPDATITSIPYYKGYFFLLQCELAVGRERFDEFIQKYMQKYQFQSLTTEEFLNFLKGELPEVFEKVDVQTWVYETGMPEEWHLPQSDLYDEVQEVLAAYKNGKRPVKDQIVDWHRFQIFSFLEALPEQIPVEDCKYFEEALELGKKNDSAHYSYYFSTCIRSGYEEILPRVETYINRIGRGLYIKPIFRAMIATEWAREHARRILEEVRDQHHQITIHVIDGLLSEAGL